MHFCPSYYNAISIRHKYSLQNSFSDTPYTQSNPVITTLVYTTPRLYSRIICGTNNSSLVTTELCYSGITTQKTLSWCYNRDGLYSHQAGREPNFISMRKNTQNYSVRNTTLRTYRQMDRQRVLNGLSCSRVLNDIAYVLYLLFTLDYLSTSV